MALTIKELENAKPKAKSTRCSTEAASVCSFCYERRSKNRPQNAAGAAFCGGVKVVHRRILGS